MMNNILKSIYGSLLLKRTFNNKSIVTVLDHCIQERCAMLGAKKIHSFSKISNRDLLDITKIQKTVNNVRKFSANVAPRTQLMDLQVFASPNFFFMISKVFHTFLIKNLDEEFNMTEFMTSAQTALVVVTELLSEQNFSELKGLLSSECLQEVEKNVRAMDTDQRKSLVVAEDDIFVAFPYRTKVHKGETEDKKQRIFFEVTVVFHVYKGYKDSTKQDAWAVFSNAKPELLTVYNCRFIREFTSEVEDQWTINAINLYKMNENPEYMYYRHNK